MKPLQKAFGISAHVIKSCSKATGKVTHFLIRKVIGAGGSVTIQSLLLASNAWLLYAGKFSARKLHLCAEWSAARSVLWTLSQLCRSKGYEPLHDALLTSRRGEGMEEGSICQHCQAPRRPGRGRLEVCFEESACLGEGILLHIAAQRIAPRSCPPVASL